MARHSLSLIDIEQAFGTEEKCIDYLEAFRWPGGVRCLKCQSDKVTRFKTNETTRERFSKKLGKMVEVRVPARHLYQCNAEETLKNGDTLRCGHQFSATAGTIFADTHLPLTTWFKAIGLMMNAKKGISACQMQRDLGCHYRTAWHLNHRIREAMQSAEGLFGGTVEVDATFVGGTYDPRRKRAPYEKQAVAGVIQRKTEDTHSKVRAFPVEREIAKVMTGVIRDNVAVDAEVMTDEHKAYMKLSKHGWKHEIVSHSQEEWVRGNVHTQGIESFWSLFKRGVIGSFHQVSVKHLHRYLNEFSFRFNNRESDAIFAMVVMNLLAGSVLRYKTLTAKISEPSGDAFVSE
jgi:transposase-like protein